MTSSIDFNRVQQLKEKLQAESIISNATPVQKARLIANMLVARDMAQKLMVPDYRPPFVGIIRGMFGDCSHMPETLNNPVVCNGCRKQIGTVAGLACAVHTVHDECKFNFREPPWFKTSGLHAVAVAAFPNNRNAMALLIHYIITEYLRYEQFKQQRFAAQGSADGFEHLSSLSD